MKILVPDHYHEGWIERIRAVSSNIKVVKLTITKEYNNFWRGVRWISLRCLPFVLHERIAHFLDQAYCRKGFLLDSKNPEGTERGIEVFLASWVITPDIFARLLPLLPGLKWVHSTVTGVDHLLSSEMIKRDIVITSSIGIHKKRIAEFVIALILTVAKKIPEHLRLQRKRKWESLTADEIERKTVGIIGLGNIGREVAGKAIALGMKVVATKKNQIEIEGVNLLPPEKLPELLKVSDFVVIAAPLTKETFGMIGKKELQMMKKSAYLINVSRGEIVQEETLIQALRKNLIAGACLDVFSSMPLPPNSPFYSLNNLIISHHSAFSSPHSNREVFDFFIANLERYVSGKKLLYMVDKERGY